MSSIELVEQETKSYAIYHNLVINASIKEVFKRIIEPDHLINWWPLKCTGTPQLGAIYNFYFDESYDWFGKVIQIEPETSFHIKMTDSDSDWNPTTFGFDLEELKSGVQVKFWHVGWPECNTHFKRSSYCWAMLLNGLKNYTEQEIVIPFEQRD
tara:strand:+ start:37882 stop:38343 length:462 start_codon:yes stop_codon:yes gene_type:complete